MVVSDAFETFTQVLECLDSSDTEVKSVSVRGQTTADNDEISADLTLATPVFGGVSIHDDVSVDAEEFDVIDKRIEIDVTVTVPVGTNIPVPSGDQGDTSNELAETLSQSDSVPAYKDPEALQAAYDACDTFPEMTEALDADVTSETVRRYMVEYDIHDPTDTTPQAGGLSLADVQAESDTDTDAGPDAGSDPSDDRVSDNSQPEEPDGLGARSVADLLAEADSQDSDDNLVADGLGISQDVTVAQLAQTVTQSNSLDEVTQRLDLSQTHARRLLSELDLLDLVTHRLAANQIRVSNAEIKRRISAASH
ncbi:hypothetical protein BDK61_3935 [Haloarcula quadrata]|uniref:Uncharacterized protein n=3 Tax=Haloarcula TaxID=2237 RepID=Q5V691_HALMA|nr:MULTISPECIES: hypothetical protein [Haloarcula]AAV44961.1 unknown [Haloarcula marismortui ATCC 43049]EMA10521.1 hypothetical protein C435_20573 [Haloarcula californiae ATCC 33799]NHX40795.1 hypothetical protein [Haloarcula sp. R1-2]NHX41150.1 hypothetical protein [Haloarcula sp. R1-2]QCP90261.1 hypothetical protein E6P14_05155 [Haloarcula marismortui ATCC 43049]